MARLVLQRLALLIPTLLGLSVLLFLWVRALPGGPATALLGERATPEAVERINRPYGFDRPVVGWDAGDAGEGVDLPLTPVGADQELADLDVGGSGDDEDDRVGDVFGLEEAGVGPLVLAGFEDLGPDVGEQLGRDGAGLDQ